MDFNLLIENLKYKQSEPVISKKKEKKEEKVDVGLFLQELEKKTKTKKSPKKGKCECSGGEDNYPYLIFDGKKSDDEQFLLFNDNEKSSVSDVDLSVPPILYCGNKEKKSVKDNYTNISNILINFL
jgi:hypothetical protein